MQGHLSRDAPSARGSWSPHGVDGCYVGPAMEHCRCYKVWIEEKLGRNALTGNTLVWLPKVTPVPKTSSADAAIVAAHELLHALQNPHPAAPLAPLRDEHRLKLFRKALRDDFQQCDPSRICQDLLARGLKVRRFVTCWLHVLWRIL